MERFLRTRRLLGEESFSRLQQRHVTVIGLGAVGGYAVEGLARAGIGSLRLVDYDIIQASNINRQVLALDSTIDRLKAEVAAERVLDINPMCRVEPMQVFVDEEAMQGLLDPQPDLVIDAIDSLNPKVGLLTTVHSRGIPVISSMGAALRTDPAKVAFADISKTYGCPLAKHVRKRLRRRGIEQGVGCVYSSEPVRFTYTDPEEEVESAKATEYDDRGRKRRVLGSLPTLTGIFGLIIANRAIMQLAGTDADERV